MSSSNQDCQTTKDKYMKEIYSGDASRNRNLQEDTTRLYMLNVVLIIIYYFLLLFFVFLIFTDIRDGPNIIKKTVLLIILLLYPFIIFPFQYNVYHGIKNITNRVFQNIYLSKDW